MRGLLRESTLQPGAEGFGHPRSARTAHAEVSDVGKAMAQILFEEGRTLVEKGDVDAACDRFERSQKLDAANGTLLNVAHCYERAGRVATTWLMFHDALGAAMRDGSFRSRNVRA